MVQLKKYFEEERNGRFSKYDSLQISPVHIHRSKAEHKHAIFVLGTELAKTIARDDSPGIGRTSTRMEELADQNMPSSPSPKLEA